MASYTLRNTYVVLYENVVGAAGYTSWNDASARANARLDALELAVAANPTLPEITSENGAEALLLKIGTGKISWTEAKSYEYDLERGKLDPAGLGTATEGDDTPMSVSFDAVVEYYLGLTDTATTKNPREFLNVDGDTTQCYPLTVDIAVYVTECQYGRAGNFYIADFRWESLAYDPAAGTLAVSGQSIFPTAFVPNEE
jgi:hypothetical protein